VEKKAGSPDAAADNIGREGISIGGPEKVEEAAGAGKICRGGISNGAPEKVKEAAGAGQICREGISNGASEKVKEAAGAGKICREGISNWEPEKVEEAAGAGKICREGIGTNVVLRRQKNVTDGSVGGSSSIAVQAGDRTNWKRAVSRSTFLSTTSRNTDQIWSSNILSASGF
jgi:hypothetical protein